MSIASKIKIEWITTEVQESGTGLGVGSKNHVVSQEFNLSDGTTADKADGVYSKSGTLTGTTPEDIDLFGGITDTFGATISMVEIVAIWIKNTHATATITVGGDGTQPVNLMGTASHTNTIQPGGFMFLYGPSAAGQSGVIGAGSADILQLVGSASATYDLKILFRTA